MDLAGPSDARLPAIEAPRPAHRRHGPIRTLGVALSVVLGHAPEAAAVPRSDPDALALLANHEVQVLDPAVHTVVGSPAHGRRDRYRLRDPSGTEQLFKVSSPEEALNAVAATLVADAMGIPTPPVTLASFQGRLGTLQPWAAGTVALPDLRLDHPEVHAALVESPSFQAQRRRIRAFDHVINKADHFNALNLLVRVGDPDAPEVGDPPEVLAVDNDLAFYLTRLAPAPAVVDEETRAALRSLLAGWGPLSERLALCIGADKAAGVHDRAAALLAAAEGAR